MKFQLKALVAALTLVASGAAVAANNPASGNSTLLLSVFDRQNQKEVWFDTGWTYDTFNEIADATHVDSGFNTASKSVSFDLSSNAAFNSFIQTADAAHTYFVLFAGDTSGSGSLAGGKGIISTFVTSAYDPSSSDPVDPFGWAKSSLVNEGTKAYNAITGVTAGGALKYYANDTTGNFGPSAVSLIGGSLGLYQTVQNATTDTSTFIYSNTSVSFNNNGLLTVSSIQATTPVPEADSYAMMGVGLALVAAMTRRRKSA